MTTRILAVDTTCEYGSVALIENDRVMEEVAIHAPDGFGQALFGYLEKWRLTLKDIDCFACAQGPGTFTGVRIGLAAMKGLAFALSKPVCAISNLQAIAFLGSEPLRAAFLDARRDQIFGAVYDAQSNLICGEVVTSLPRWMASLDGKEVEYLTTDLELCSVGPMSTKAVGTSLAGAVGVLASRKYAQGQAGHARSIDANYVRRADAEMSWEDK